MFRRSPPLTTAMDAPPSPAAPATPMSGLSAGLGATTIGRQNQPGAGAGAAMAALVGLRMGMAGMSNHSATIATPAASAAQGATHVRKSSRRQASRDLKEMKLTSKEIKAQKAAEKAHSKAIDAMLAQQQAYEKKVAKILLLGPGESGKSTLFKQIQKNYGAGFDATERKKHHIIVVSNVLRSIKSLLWHSERLLQRLPFSALRNESKASTTHVHPSLAESKSYIERVNLYKLFEGRGLEIETVHLNEGEEAAPPSPEISPTNASTTASGSSSSSCSEPSSRPLSASSSLAAASDAGLLSPPPPVIPGESSLINLTTPAGNMYGGKLHHPSTGVKLNPSGRFVPQILLRGADGRTTEEIFHEVLTHCYLLWKDPGIKCTFENRALFDFHQLFDSDSYFLSKLASGALLQPSYIPSDEDLIRVRIRTTAINVVDFEMKADESDRNSEMIPMRMMDVAGQRSERKKWIPYFQDATAVIFVAALSEYDQVLAEDGVTNRLLESVHLFTEIMNSHWFRDTPLVLFLNKCDLFAEKIRRVPLNVLYPKYNGKNSYTSACEFLCREFVKRRKDPNKVIHIHVVSAIQVDLIKTAMDSVKQMLIQRSLQHAGLMQ